MMQNRLIIGLTGGSGSGKSVVSDAAKDLGFVHIDTDKIGHHILLKPSKAYYEVIKHFGNEILMQNEEIDRKKLGEIVFNNKEKLDLLTSITHPAIEDEVNNMLGEYTLIDGAVLHKSQRICDMCDYIIAVTNSDERRIELIVKRDNINEESAINRIKSQPDNDFYVKNADFVIENDGTIEELYNKSINIIKRCISEKIV